MGATHYTKRSEAGEDLLRTMRRHVRLAAAGVRPTETQVGTFAGFPMVVDAKPRHGSVNLVGAPVGYGYSAEDLVDASPTGTIVKLENQLRNLEVRRTELQLRVDELVKQKAAAENRIGKPFDQQARLDALTKRKNEIEKGLTPKQETPAEPRVDGTAGITRAGAPSTLATGGATIEERLKSSRSTTDTLPGRARNQQPSPVFRNPTNGR